MPRIVLLLVGLTLLGMARADAEEALLADLRERLIETIVADTSETRHYTGREVLAPATLAAMAEVQRHHFTEGYGPRAAYANRPLPIGHGQTISQPFIVALMTDLLDLQPGARVLEIGTGSGYQAAVLSVLAAHVYTIEIVEPLAVTAIERLEAHGYRNVTVRVADGYHGWPEAAPFDGIMVTAAGDHVPPALLEQLAPGARLVLPLKQPGGGEQLTVVRVGKDGVLQRREVLPVMFVPLTGDH